MAQLAQCAIAIQISLSQLQAIGANINLKNPVYYDIRQSKMTQIPLETGFLHSEQFYLFTHQHSNSNQ